MTARHVNGQRVHATRGKSVSVFVTRWTSLNLTGIVDQSPSSRCAILLTASMWVWKNGFRGWTWRAGHRLRCGGPAGHRPRCGGPAGHLCARTWAAVASLRHSILNTGIVIDSATLRNACSAWWRTTSTRPDRSQIQIRHRIWARGPPKTWGPEHPSSSKKIKDAKDCDGGKSTFLF